MSNQLHKSGTVLVSFRLRGWLHEQLVNRADSAGFSPGGYAREVLLQALARGQAERRVIEELVIELQKLRADHALATEAILTLVGSKDGLSHEEASAWVRKNLNR